MISQGFIVVWQMLHLRHISCNLDICKYGWVNNKYKLKIQSFSCTSHISSAQSPRRAGRTLLPSADTHYDHWRKLCWRELSRLCGLRPTPFYPLAVWFCINYLAFQCLRLLISKMEIIIIATWQNFWGSIKIIHSRWVLQYCKQFLLILTTIIASLWWESSLAGVVLSVNTWQLLPGHLSNVWAESKRS